MEENKKQKQAINIIQDSSGGIKKQTQAIQPSPPPPPPPPRRSTQSPSLPNSSSPSPYRRPSPTMPTALAASPGLPTAGISSSSYVGACPLYTSSSACVPTPKHEAGPKKSQKMGHPVYKGAYERRGGWSSSIWGPAGTGIHLGTYPIHPPRSTQSPSLPNSSSPSPYRRPSPTMPTALAASPGLPTAGIFSSSSVGACPLYTSSSACVRTPNHETGPMKSQKMGHPVYKGAYERRGGRSSSIWGPAGTGIHLGTYPIHPPRSTQSPSLPNSSSPSPYRRPSPTMPTALAASPGLPTAGISSSSSVGACPLYTSSSARVPAPNHEAGLKKAKKMGHPVYKGAYERSGSWSSKIWGPAGIGIYLGTYPTPEMAARARDAAAIAMRGELADLNFIDSAWLLPRASSVSPDEIRRVASKAAEMFRPGAAPAPLTTPSTLAPSETSSTLAPMETAPSSVPTERPSSSAPAETASLSAPVETATSSAPVETPSSSVPMETPSSSAPTEDPLPWSPLMSMSAATQAPFVDEDELFNMPAILNDMAEGLMIPPPRRYAGSDDDDDDGTGDDHVDIPLWTN